LCVHFIGLQEKTDKYTGGIYHKTQIDLTYNSNHMEGSRLTHDQTRYIFETNMIGVENEVLNVDDVIETANHFCCIDMIIDHTTTICIILIFNKFTFQTKWEFIHDIDTSIFIISCNH